MVKLKDKKIEIFEDHEGYDDWGFFVHEWRKIHQGRLWAYYRQLSGKEIFASAQVLQSEDALFTINWRDGLDTGMVVKHNGKYYDITRIDDFEGYKTALNLYCNYNPARYSDIEDVDDWDDEDDWGGW